MSKIFTFLFALVVLLYVFLLYSFRLADPLNSFNQRNRNFFLQSKLTRSLFFLNRPGDARFDYLSSKSDSVLVEIDYQVGRKPNENLEEWVGGVISELLRKDVEIYISEQREISDVDEFSDRELRRLAEITRDYSSSKEQNYLHVLYVSKSFEAPSNTGLVLTADGFFIFKDGIDSLSENSGIRSLIEESTIKHELGHLLGLEHVDSENCIMSERVEVYEGRKYQFESIPSEFCEESLEELRRMRESIL